MHKNILNNPFSIQKYGTELSFKLYKTYLEHVLPTANIDFKHKTLLCSCSHKLCHGQVLRQVIFSIFRNYQ